MYVTNSNQNLLHILYIETAFTKEKERNDCDVLTTDKGANRLSHGRDRMGLIGVHFTITMIKTNNTL